MKTIFKSTILLAAVGLSLFTSCKDDNESNPTLTQPTAFEIYLQPSFDGKVNLDLEKTEAPLVLSWSQPTPYNNFNAPVVPTYTIQVSPTGTFNQAFDASAEDNSGADFFTINETYSSGKGAEISTQSLNRSLVEFFGWSESTMPAQQPVSIRVKSAIRDASFNEYDVIYSNVITISTVPYYIVLKNADPEIWWLIGADIADGSWGGDIAKCVIPMQTIEGCEYDKKTGQGEIQWIGYLGGNGFKLRGSMDDGWATQIGQNDGGYVKNDGGSGNITVSEPGLYKITLNTAELAKVGDKENTTALTIEKYDGSAPVYDGMAISGSFNGWSDTDMTPCSTGWENHDWYTTYDFAAGDEVKIKQAASWDFNKGGEFIPYGEGMYVYGVGNGANLVVTEAGKYMIIFNDITGYIRFIKQ
jgi:hypothetical protein